MVLEPYSPRADGRDKLTSSKALKGLQRITHQTIKKVTDDLEKIRFNTMIAALMEFTNYLAKAKETGVVSSSDWGVAIDVLLRLLAPTAPHLAEELWQWIGCDYSIHNQDWPRWDEDLTKDAEITLVVQVNGKLRDRIVVSASIIEDEARQIALGRDRVKGYIESKEIINVVYVPGRLVNVVVR